MKKQRFRFKLLALFLFGLFLALMLYGGYNVINYGNRWFSSSKNPRLREQKQNVIAGSIYDRNGVALAWTDEDGNRVYQTSKAAREAIVHLLGDSDGNVSNGIESFQTSYLYGFQSSLPELISGLISGETRHGDNISITADSRLCTAIAKAFTSHSTTSGKNGAAVVMNYQTGEVLAMVSLPSFDPENITDDVIASSDSPFWNRAVQAVYPPGSTFKTVTAAAALENLSGVESVTYTCGSSLLSVDGSLIGDYQGEKHGTITIREAFTESCNKMFANIAMNVGKSAMIRTAERFGFNDNFLFRDLVVENSSYPTSFSDDYELAASGFGQASVSATPLHMCMIAAAVANGGVMMEPRLLQSVISYSGIQRLSYTSSIYRTAMSEDIAATLKSYMRSVVTDGTGKRAAVSGMTICGKTGTSDSTSDGAEITYGWFTGFNDDAELPFAVAVLVENIDENTSGGTTAALIASDIFTYLRDHADLVK